MRIFILFILLFQALASSAQHDLREILTKSFFDKRIYDKIFFEYTGADATFLQGYKTGLKGAFVLPDTNIQRQWPMVLEVVGISHATEKQFMTSTFISHPDGKVFFTSHIMDPAILLFVNFDSLSIKKKHAFFNFHTTSWHYYESLKKNYVRVECEMIRRRSGWKIKYLKVTPIQCCSRLW